MLGVAERFDVVVTGVDDASHSAVHELALELTELTGMPSGDVQLALLQGELVVRRSVDPGQGQRALDELRGLGAKVTLRPVDNAAGIPFMDIPDSQALDLELEPDPDELTGGSAGGSGGGSAESSTSGLAPPPFFGELGTSVAPPTSVQLDDPRPVKPVANGGGRPGTMPPGGAPRRHPSGSVPRAVPHPGAPMSAGYVHRHPTGPIPAVGAVPSRGPAYRHPTGSMSSPGPAPGPRMDPRHRHPTGSMPPVPTQPHPPLDYRPAARPPTMPPGYPPAPMPGPPSRPSGPASMPTGGSSSAGSEAHDVASDLGGMASLARGLDLALVDLDEDSKSDQPAVLEEVSSGDGEARRPASVARSEAAPPRTRSTPPSPDIDDPGAVEVGEDDGVLELDLAAAGLAKPPAPSIPSSEPPARTVHEPSIPGASPVPVSPAASSAGMSAPAMSALEQPDLEVADGPRYPFGRDIVTSVIAGIAAAMFVTMLVAFAVSRGSFRDDITRLEAEIAESMTRPLDVQAQELRSVDTIRQDLDEVHASSEKRFLLIWIGLGLPLGIVLGRFRVG